MVMRSDLSSQAFFRNPAVAIEKLRSEGGMVKIPFPIVGEVWTTTTHELTERVLNDSDGFTLRQEDGSVAGMPRWMPGILRTVTNNMLTVDEPDHGRLRHIVDEAFRRRAILDMEPRILAIADELAKELFAAGSPADVVDRFARALPLSVICELLGLPLADRPKFTAWASSLTRFTGTVGFLSVIPNIFAMKHYMARQLVAVSKRGGEGLIAELVRVEKEGGRISRDEMVAMLFLLLFAGHETTTHLISGSVFELLRHPHLRDWLQEDWSRAGLAVEEFLRFITPVQFTKPRYARRDTELGGVRVKRGEKVMPMLAAANFDPQANNGPELLNLEREPNRHLAFGSGIHFCLGHQLARLEGACALKALLRRWPTLELAVQESQVRWRRRPGLRAIEHLPVRVGTQPGRG